jgi:ABC-type lipoprotein export system ATPase subunit
LLAGRDKQIALVIDAVNQKGQHVIICGERGVGKTSLFNVLKSFLAHCAGVSRRAAGGEGDSGVSAAHVQQIREHERAHRPRVRRTIRYSKSD